jgi:hypothetical protein
VFKNLFKKPGNPRRDLLFGDMPLDQWPSGDSADGPFADFILARQSLEANNSAAAIDIWQRIAGTPGLESRHYLQAWTFLRDRGRQPPPAIAKQVRGVVVEVGMPEGLDLLAAYQDHSSRYYNFSGAGVVWEHPDPSLDAHIDCVLRRGSTLASHIGPWNRERPGPPRTDNVRLNLLTPGGLHFGEGPMNAIMQDPQSSPLFQAATVLMQALIAKQGR